MPLRRELLPIFPLSNVVLFPRVETPLHLFEPRYRQLGEHVLGGARRLGMVVVRPEFVDEMPGDPPVFPIGCAGHVPKGRRLPDGRYEIVLAGTERFRILEEPERPPDQLYRVALVELLDDSFEPADQQRVERLRSRVVELTHSLARLLGSQDELPERFFEDFDDVSFVNALSNALALRSDEKQGLLEVDGIPQRYERLSGLLEFRLAELSPAGSTGRGSVH